MRKQQRRKSLTRWSVCYCIGLIASATRGGDGRIGKGRVVTPADSRIGLGAEQPQIAKGKLLRLEQVRASAQGISPRAAARASVHVVALPASSPRQIRHARLSQLRTALRFLL